MKASEFLRGILAALLTLTVVAAGGLAAFVAWSKEHRARLAAEDRAELAQLGVWNPRAPTAPSPSTAPTVTEARRG